ncbi:MAG: response regulator [Planctomycetaceae bacterium]|nr:response regulator [Planctomycetaceae bacterium]
MRTSFRLLIADDDRGVREAFRAIFEPYFDLVEAESGDEACDVIESVRVDIALLDMHMPRRTGLEALRTLKRIYVNAPGILVTAAATDDIRRDAIAARAYRVLDKPIRKNDLVSTVDAALRSAYGDFPGLAALTA